MCGSLYQPGWKRSLPLEKEQETSLMRVNLAQHLERSRAPETAQEERTETWPKSEPNPDNRANPAYCNPFLPKSSNFLSLLPQRHHSGVAGPEIQQGLSTHSSQPRNQSSIQASPGSSKGHPLKKKEERRGGEWGKERVKVRGEKRGGEEKKKEKEKRGEEKTTLAMRGRTCSYLFTKPLLQLLSS